MKPLKYTEKLYNFGEFVCSVDMMMCTGAQSLGMSNEPLARRGEQHIIQMI